MANGAMVCGGSHCPLLGAKVPFGQSRGHWQRLPEFLKFIQTSFKSWWESLSWDLLHVMGLVEHHRPSQVYPGCPACCGGCCASPCLTDEACDDTIIFLIGTTAKKQSLRASSQPVWLQSISHQKTQTYVYLQVFSEESWRRC